MATTTAAAGTKFSIASGTPTAWTEAVLGALTWKSVGKITNLGEIGSKFEEIKSQYLESGFVARRKGVQDLGTLTIEVDSDTSDEGQTMVLAAQASSSEYNGLVEFSSGVKAYFRCLVMAAPRKSGGPNNMLSMSIQLALNPFKDATGEHGILEVQPV